MKRLPRHNTYAFCQRICRTIYRCICRRAITLLLLLLGGVLPLPMHAQALPVQAQDKPDESGPVLLTGKITYTNPFFTVGVAAPLIVLEDQAGFIDRDPGFVIS